MPNEPNSKKETTFVANYELTTLISQEACSLLSPNGVSNPGYMATIVGLSLLLAYCIFTDANVVLALIGVAICVALLYLGQRWGTVIQKRVANAGLDPLSMPEAARQFRVTVTLDGITVERPEAPRISPATYAPGDVKRVRQSSKLLLIQMKDRAMVLIPRKALSESRFKAAGEQLKGFASNGK